MVVNAVINQTGITWNSWNYCYGLARVTIEQQESIEEKGKCSM